MKPTYTSKARPTWPAEGVIVQYRRARAPVNPSRPTGWRVVVCHAGRRSFGTFAKTRAEAEQMAAEECAAVARGEYDETEQDKARQALAAAAQQIMRRRQDSWYEAAMQEARRQHPRLAALTGRCALMPPRPRRLRIVPPDRRLDG